jgi:multidrug efflux pump subunit AcrA (membrane-fusion protein)
VAPESTRGPNIRELESLRITRSEESPRRRLLLPFVLAVLAVAILGVAGYAVYAHTLGKPLEVQTAPVTLIAAEQQGPLLTGSGYVITRDKYITIGTKILGQIVEEPIEEGRHVKRGDLLARIDDRDYQAQLHQANADRDLAAANLKLAAIKAGRERALYRNGVASHDETRRGRKYVGGRPRRPQTGRCFDRLRPLQREPVRDHLADKRRRAPEVSGGR